MKKKNKEYKTNQGRSQRQVESNYKLVFWSVVGLAISIVLIFIDKLFLQ